MKRWVVFSAIVASLLATPLFGLGASVEAKGCQAFGQHVMSEAIEAHPLGRAIVDAGLPPLNDEAAAEQAEFCN